MSLAPRRRNGLWAREQRENVIVSDNPATHQCGCRAAWRLGFGAESSSSFQRVGPSQAGKWWAPGTLTNPGPTPVITCGCGTFMRCLTAGRFGCPRCGERANLVPCVQHAQVPYHVWGLPALRFDTDLNDTLEGQDPVTKGPREGAANDPADRLVGPRDRLGKTCLTAGPRDLTADRHTRRPRGERIKRTLSQGSLRTLSGDAAPATPRKHSAFSEVCGLCLTTLNRPLPGQTHPLPTGAYQCSFAIPGGVPLPGLYHLIGEYN